MNIVYVIVGFFAAIVSSMGLGGGCILLIYLTAFAGVNQYTAQGINLWFFIPVGALSLFFHIKNGLIEKKSAIIAAIFGLIGVIPGFLLTKYLGGVIVSKLFATGILILGFYELFMPIKKK